MTAFWLCIANAMGAAQGEPFVPSDPAAVILELPPREGPAWSEIRELRVVLDAAPDAPDVAAALAERYLAMFRREGDPRLVGYAAATLSRWDLENPSLPTPAALALISIEQLQHHFDAAVMGLDRVLASDPMHAQARFMRASIALVQGRYPEAKSDCARLVLAADAVIAGACLATVQTVTGEADRARMFLRASLARGADSDPEFESWLQTLAAENAAALGFSNEAQEHFRAAIAAARRGAAQPTTYLLSAYADFLIDAGRYGDSLSLLSSAPVNVSTLLRTATASKHLLRDMEDQLARLSHSLELALSGHDNEHAREAAYFALRLREDSRTALALALENWTVQREPLDARLVLESAASLCDAAAAAPVIDWIKTHAVQHVALEHARNALRTCR
jgi:tetratricopeptide (TPR) repeat protein